MSWTGPEHCPCCHQIIPGSIGNLEITIKELNTLLNDPDTPIQNMAIDDNGVTWMEKDGKPFANIKIVEEKQ